MTTLNFQDLQIKLPKAPATAYSKNAFEMTHHAIDRINLYLEKKGKISSSQEGQYEILTYAMQNEVNGDSLESAISTSRRDMNLAREIIKK